MEDMDGVVAFVMTNCREAPNRVVECRGLVLLIGDEGGLFDTKDVDVASLADMFCITEGVEAPASRARDM